MDESIEPCGTPEQNVSGKAATPLDSAKSPEVHSTKSSAQSVKSEPKSDKTKTSVHSKASVSKASVKSNKSDQKSNNESIKVSFELRTAFDASENLFNTRSESYRIEKPPVEYSILTKPAVDFRPQAYRPRPPKRNTQAATQPWRYNTDSDEYYDEALKERREQLKLPKVLGPRPPPPYKFQAGYRAIDPHDDRMQQAGESGHLGRDMYRMPQPHDFRGYPSLKSLGLPEFTCSYERDPYNNKIHTRSQRTITGPPPQIVSRDIELGLFVQPLHQPPKWEAYNHHVPDPFPNRPASYTRFRRTGRDPHSAFMDRVTETMDAQWARERYENALQKHQQRRTVMT